MGSLKVEKYFRIGINLISQFWLKIYFFGFPIKGQSLTQIEVNTLKSYLVDMAITSIVEEILTKKTNSTRKGDG